MAATSFMDRLMDLLGEKGRDAVYPCIRDLAVNGLQLSRLSPSDHASNRQEVTQYLAAWCRSVDLSEDVCRKWLLDYAIAMLSSISKSSPSGIRHSTKSNVKYIYRSQVPFVCGREDNPFRAQCSATCSVYTEMAGKAAIREDTAHSVVNRARTEPTTPNSFVPVKEVYKDQFMAATRLVRRELTNGTKKKRILDILKQQGMKTGTGREWTYGILCGEIRKLGEPCELEMTNQKSGTSD